MTSAPPNPPIVADLLSDTLTKPTEPMRAAMATALVGDDVFGEDPSVKALEIRVAGLLGHEAGLFTPSGSMANQLGVRLHVAQGEELITDSLAHVVRAEMGAAAVISGITTRTWIAPRGQLRAEDPLSLMVTDGGAYQVRTALVVVENTHNFGGGTIQSLVEMEALRRGTSAAGVAVHLDGARLWHAHVSTGLPLTAYGALADTVSVCLSKGLGAPVGSVLVGSRDRIEEARIWRKRMGGGMRQAGIVAAAGLYAIDHHVERLAQDHARAARMAAACAQACPGSVDPAEVATNIVIVDVALAGWTSGAFSQASAARGIRLYPVSGTAVRMVFHLDVDDAATSAAIEAVTDLLIAGP
ncbi:MAG: threonine aldolase family protein [Nostocoides sp.]